MQHDIEITESEISGRGVFARRRFRTGETVFRWDLSRKEITSDYRSGGATIDFVCRCGALNCRHGVRV